ncbi:MAG TPA: hypothetical protein VF399_09405 [bacterium]
MLFIIIGLVIVLAVLWIIISALQKGEQKRREDVIRKHKEEKAKEEESKNRFPT